MKEVLSLILGGVILTSGCSRNDTTFTTETDNGTILETEDGKPITALSLTCHLNNYST
jgi:hypothetical protein